MLDNQFCRVLMNEKFLSDMKRTKRRREREHQGADEKVERR